MRPVDDKTTSDHHWAVVSVVAFHRLGGVEIEIDAGVFGIDLPQYPIIVLFDNLYQPLYIVWIARLVGLDKLSNDLLLRDSLHPRTVTFAAHFAAAVDMARKPCRPSMTDRSTNSIWAVVGYGRLSTEPIE